jgi:hypothetical protein
MSFITERGKSVCTSTVVVSSGPLSPAPSTYSAMNIPENTEQDMTTLNQHEGGMRVEYCCD